MESFLEKYVQCEEEILQRLKSNGIEHRTKANSGLWLGTLVGLSGAITLLKEDASYSEICLITGITGFGLIISSLSLYLRLVIGKTAVKDFQAVYFVPAIITSMLYLYIANKGLLVSATWGLTVGSLGTWGILQLMAAFPYCFTIGEATTVMHSLILFLMSVVTNLPLRYHLPPIHDSDIATAFLQVVISYVILLCLLCGYFPIFHEARYFYFMASILLVCVVVPMLYIILDQNPIIWGLRFAFGSTQRILLFAYWAGCLSFSAIYLIVRTSENCRATTAGRKSFHVLAVFVYIPGLIYERTLLYFASGMIFGLFVILELLRFLSMPPLGNRLQRSFAVFADEKDVLISLTALYLLCGLSFPLWMPTNNLPLLPLLSGVLTVGIGDTAASFIGSKWGSHKWPSTEKSIEGTVACVLSQIALILSLNCLGFISSGWLLLRTLLASIALSFIEARTNQVDNLALPLLMYTCLRI